MSWSLDLATGDVWASWQDPSTDTPYANLVTDYGWDETWTGDVPLEMMRTGPMADAAADAAANNNTARRIQIAEDALYGRIEPIA